MYKKILSSILITWVIITSSITWVFADDISTDEDNNSQIDEKIIETAAKESNLPDINSRAAVVIDRNSNTILFGKNENSKRKMASTTKIMTCIVIIENCNLNDNVVVSKKSAGTGGSRLGLKTGDKITVKDLLYGLMLCSGNDAAVALAEYLSGSVNDFALLMNKKAKQLDLANTNFETPHGLDSDNHYTTAYELALLANYALNNSTFAKIVGTKYYTVTINGYPKNITNTNELLGNLNGVYGIKTGFTNGANRCLVTSCKRNDLDIICVVLGADTKKFRTNDSIKLIEYCFKTYKPVDVENIISKKFEEWKKDNLKDFSIIKGQNQNVKIKLNKLDYTIIPIEINSLDNLECLITCEKKFYAPIFSNSEIGVVEVYCNKKLITKAEILLDCNIMKKNITDYFINFLKNYRNIYNFTNF